MGAHTGIHSPTLDTSLASYNPTGLTTTNERVTTLEDSDEKHY
jgi:hypothetical protein